MFVIREGLYAHPVDLQTFSTNNTIVPPSLRLHVRFTTASTCKCHWCPVYHCQHKTRGSKNNKSYCNYTVRFFLPGVRHRTVRAGIYRAFQD